MDLSEARDVFMQESSELLDRMEALLIEESQNPRGERETIDSLFRVVHTIKGSAGIFGFETIEKFSHELESLLDDARSGKRSFDMPLVELLLRCRDHLSNLLQLLSVREESAGAVLSAQLNETQSQLLSEVRLLAGSSQAPSRAQSNPASQPGSLSTFEISLWFRPELFQHGLDPLPVVRNLRACGEVVSFHLNTDRLPALSAMHPETCYLGCEMRLRTELTEAQIRSELEFVQEDCEIEIRMQPAAAQPETRPEPAAAPSAPAATVQSAQQAPRETSQGSPAMPTDSRFVRVESARLDHLVNLVGELVIQSAHLNQVAEKSGVMDLAESADSVYKIVSALRDHAFGLRMIPIGGVFSRFQRVIHDLKSELGKEVHLELKGQETELDKSMVERLYDPLLHLVRNSLDHGIESPDERVRAGKPAGAVIRLSARHEASEIIIEVEDDGRGLNTEKILARARDRGLVRPEETPDEAEIHRLIFQAGFSTAEKVTNLSGRGVGMDVVKREIQGMRGRIDIESRRGKGSLIRIRLPLTLAIIDGLCVRIGESFFVVPLDIVVECLEFQGRAGGMIDLRGEALPLIHLDRVFNIVSAQDDNENIVVVQHAGRRAGVAVQEIMGEVQSVIRPIGKMLGDVEGISGSTILGDGTIALILDLAAIVDGLVRKDREPRPMVNLRTIRGPEVQG